MQIAEVLYLQLLSKFVRPRLLLKFLSSSAIATNYQLLPRFQTISVWAFSTLSVQLGSICHRGSLWKTRGGKKGHLWDRGEIHDLVSVIKNLTDGPVNQPHSLGCLIPPERTVRANSVGSFCCPLEKGTAKLPGRSQINSPNRFRNPRSITRLECHWTWSVTPTAVPRKCLVLELLQSGLSTGKGVRINHNHNQVSFQKEITIRSVYVHEPLSVRVWS